MARPQIPLKRAPGYGTSPTSAGNRASERIRPRPRAEIDLDEIWEYIAADSVDAADQWIQELFDSFEALGRTPGIGHRRDDLTEWTVLFWAVGAYLVIYRAERRPIEIVAVTQGSRDIPAVLRPRR